MANFVFRDYTISVLSVGLKRGTGIGSKIFYGDLNISVSLWFSDVCSVYQKEIYAINKSAKRNSHFSF